MRIRFGGDVVINFGNRLRQMRKAKGYSQQQIADLVGVHRTTYTRYESGAVEPPLDTLCRMADLMGCTTDELLGRG